MSPGSEYSQAARLIGIQTPLGADVLLLRGMKVRERLSSLFEIELDLLSESGELSPADLLGQSVTVRLEMLNEQTRYFNGYVSRFAHVGFEGRLATYEATLVPWLWLLTRTSDCRIFQEMSVPDIVKQVSSDAGFTDVDDRLAGEYGAREYCVQYRESHFNFVTRLLEQEGIYWFFTHQAGKHRLVLADGYSSHQIFPGYERIRYHAADLAAERDRDFIHRWSCASSLRSGAFVHDDFDFKKPSAELRSNAAMARSNAHADYEVYDYPGAYVAPGEGQRYASVRMEELQCDQEVARGVSYCRGLATGCLFILADYPRADQNREYLLTSVLHSLKTDAFQSSDAPSAEMLYEASFTAMDAKQPFRAPRVTPKSTVRGPHTAMVVGPPGEEIWTDEYGRVKVQFHWDRYGQMDQNSSCWVRVSQPWAGQSWGAIHIPRIGQEVIVDFLEGDPDRPIITGRVYNAEKMPPWGLPAAGVVSGFKSNTHKGAGYNELSMDDTAGREQITIHGQYDMNTTVEHDQTSTVRNNRTDVIGVDDSETVGANQSLSIGADQTIQIGGSRSETVGGAESVAIGGHRTETVGGGETVTVSGGRSHSVNGAQTTTISVAESHSVGAGRMHNVGGGEAISVGGVQAVSVGGVQTVSVGGAQMVNVGALQSVTVGGPHKLSAAVISETSKGPVKIKAGAICVVEAPRIVLKAGGSQIILDAGGVTIKGAKITLEAKGNVTINGPGGIKLKGSTIGEN